MKKHDLTIAGSEMAPPGSSPERMLLAALASIQSESEIQKAHAEEDRLGLSFVSEQKARDLLRLLDQLVPYRKLA